jgi:hypothetical protein
MNAGAALQVALVEMLANEPRLAGIFEGPPARAEFPYVVVDAGHQGDWSHKSGDGREVLVALTLWDDVPARLSEVADAIETLAADVSAVRGWQLVSMRLLRRRTLRDVAGPWGTAIDFRARLLAA